MFITLFKHEWKANAKLLTLLSAFIIGMGCLAAVVLRLITTYWAVLTSQDGPALLLIPAILFLFFAYLALILYSIGVFYIQLYRFYKTRFTDHGYLMFTLPVKTSHLFLSSALHILIWGAISILVIIAALAIAIGFGLAWQFAGTDNLTTIFLTAIWDEMRFIFSDFFRPGDTPVAIVCCLILIAYSIIVPLSAIVLGSVVAKKHKVLAIIGILYGISMVSGIVNSVISFVVTFSQMESASTSMLPSLVSPSVFPLILTVIAYPLSIHLMKNKLNLP